MAKKENASEHVPESLPPVWEESPPDGSPVDGREVALFVCVICGKEKRGQKHFNFACEPCVKLK